MCSEYFSPYTKTAPKNKLLWTQSLFFMARDSRMLTPFLLIFVKVTAGTVTCATLL